MKDKIINKKGSWSRMSTIFSKPLTNDGCVIFCRAPVVFQELESTLKDSLFLPGLLSLFWGDTLCSFFPHNNYQGSLALLISWMENLRIVGI